MLPPGKILSFQKYEGPTLIQANLFGIPLYFLSLFRIFVSISMNLGRVMRDFLSEGFDKVGGLHLISWEIVVRPLESKGWVLIPRFLLLPLAVKG